MISTLLKKMTDMITMDLISHDISLYHYVVTDVIEIHLLELRVVFHSITLAPQGGKQRWLKVNREEIVTVMETFATLPIFLAN